MQTVFPALAKKLHRDSRAVTRDVKTLERYGVVRTELKAESGSWQGEDGGGDGFKLEVCDYDLRVCGGRMQQRICVTNSYSFAKFD